MIYKNIGTILLTASYMVLLSINDLNFKLDELIW